MSPGSGHEGIVQPALVGDRPSALHQIDVGDIFGSFRPILPDRIPDIPAEHGELFAHPGESLGIYFIGELPAGQLFHQEATVFSLRFNQDATVRGPNDLGRSEEPTQGG
jgi:hypothetical protein